MIHIVTSIVNESYKYLENIALSLDAKLIVYKKNNSINDIIKIKNSDKLDIYEIPNIGRCDYSFLIHIINNYNNLPDELLFIKSNMNKHNVDIIKCLKSENNYNFMNIGTHPEKININPNINNKNCRNLSHCYRNSPLDTSQKKYDSLMIVDFYNIMFPNTHLPDYLFDGFNHGPCFFIKKNLILNHSIDKYENLLKIFDDSNWTKCHFMTLNKQNDDIGKRYHDQLLRFWGLMFTHKLNLKSKITKNYIVYF